MPTALNPTAIAALIERRNQAINNYFLSPSGDRLQLESIRLINDALGFSAPEYSSTVGGLPPDAATDSNITANANLLLLQLQAIASNTAADRFEFAPVEDANGTVFYHKIDKVAGTVTPLTLNLTPFVPVPPITIAAPDNAGVPISTVFEAKTAGADWAIGDPLRRIEQWVGNSLASSAWINDRTGVVLGAAPAFNTDIDNQQDLILNKLSSIDTKIPIGTVPVGSALSTQIADGLSLSYGAVGSWQNPTLGTNILNGTTGWLDAAQYRRLIVQLNFQYEDGEPYCQLVAEQTNDVDLPPVPLVVIDNYGRPFNGLIEFPCLNSHYEIAIKCKYVRIRPFAAVPIPISTRSHLTQEQMVPLALHEIGKIRSALPPGENFIGRVGAAIATPVGFYDDSIRSLSAQRITNLFVNTGASYTTFYKIHGILGSGSITVEIQGQTNTNASDWETLYSFTAAAAGTYKTPLLPFNHQYLRYIETPTAGITVTREIYRVSSNQPALNIDSTGKLQVSLIGGAQDGTDATGTILPAGATGIRGALTAIYNAIKAIAFSVNGLKVDGSATIQPVSGAIGIDQTTDGTTNKVAANLHVGGSAYAVGTKTINNSIAVNLASDQAPSTLAQNWKFQITDGTNVMPTGDAIGRAVFNRITDGTTNIKIAPASTAAAATDPSLVVSLSPNSVDRLAANVGIVDIISATISTLATSTPIVPTFGISCAIDYAISAMSATSVDVEIQESLDNATWRTIYNFSATAAGNYRSPLIAMTGALIRYIETPAGGSVTRSITRIQSHSPSNYVPTLRYGGYNLNSIALAQMAKFKTISVCNNSGTTYFLQLFDKASALATGDVPINGCVYRLPANSTVSYGIADFGADGKFVGSNPRLGISSTFASYTAATLTATAVNVEARA